MTKHYYGDEKGQDERFLGVRGTQNWECCCCPEWRCAHLQSDKEMLEDTTGAKTEARTHKTMKMSTMVEVVVA